MQKRILSIILALSLMFSLAAAVRLDASAASFNDINRSDVFVTQQTNYTCTLASSVMMLRRTAILLGWSDWASITESTLRPTAWNEGSGLWWNYTYRGMNVKKGDFSGDKKTCLINLLNSYPQGIEVYNCGNSGQFHAVLITDYNSSTDTFYCADPAKSGGRIAFSNSTIKGSNQNQKIANLSYYWYVASPRVTLSPSVHTHDYKLAYFWASHPHYNEYKCSCGASYVDNNSVNYYSNCAECKKPIIKEGWYRIACSSNTNYVLDVEYGSKESRKRVQLYEYNSAWEQQKLYVKYVGDGYYTIMFKHSGLALDVTGGSKDPSVVLQQYPFNCSDAQLWNFIPDGNGAYFLRSKLGNFMDLRGNIVQNATPIQSYTPNYSVAQRWKLIPIGKHITFDTNGGQTYAESASATADGLNVGRGTNQLIIYNKSGCRTNTNIYGNEALVDSNNKVVSVTEYGDCNSIIPNGGFVLSGHNKMCDWISRNISEGNYVIYDEKTFEVKVFDDYESYKFNNYSQLIGQKYIDLPTPSREGYSFLGWYSEIDGGTSITSDTTVLDSEDTTLYAHWSTNAYGDADGNGAINMLDVLLIRKYIAKQPVALDTSVADVNCDNAVNMLDALLIRKFIAKQPVTLGPQK